MRAARLTSKDPANEKRKWNKNIMSISNPLEMMLHNQTFELEIRTEYFADTYLSCLLPRYLPCCPPTAQFMISQVDESALHCCHGCAASGTVFAGLGGLESIRWLCNDATVRRGL